MNFLVLFFSFPFFSFSFFDERWPQYWQTVSSPRTYLPQPGHSMVTLLAERYKGFYTPTAWYAYSTITKRDFILDSLEFALFTIKLNNSGCCSIIFSNHGTFTIPQKREYKKPEILASKSHILCDYVRLCHKKIYKDVNSSLLRGRAYPTLRLRAENNGLRGLRPLIFLQEVFS